MSGGDWRIEVSGLSGPCLIQGGWGALNALDSSATELARSGARVFVVSDRSVWGRWGDRIRGLLVAGGADPAVFLIDPGEQAKTVDGAAAVWQWLTDAGCRRDDVVVAAGGGVVGDLAGFAAATYLRGVRLWQLPTTLLSQVDSSVGGKVAVNLPAGKNLVGAFHQPESVVIDQQFLTTLPPEELASGLGEVVKCALLSGPDFLDFLDVNADRIGALEPSVLSSTVERCVRLKVEVVSEDERDTGRRAVLNLGHTFGHGLEQALGYGEISHGTAVGLGLLAALRVSEVRCGLDASVRPRVRTLLARLGLPVAIQGIDGVAVLSAISHDKKTTAGGLGFVCLRDLGRPDWGIGVTSDTLEDALEVILT
jgi:3-dehydroquinate synthase